MNIQVMDSIWGNEGGRMLIISSDKDEQNFGVSFSVCEPDKGPMLVTLAPYRVKRLVDALTNYLETTK